MAALTSFISKSVCLVPFPLSGGNVHKLYLEDSFLPSASWGHKGTSTDAGWGISELLSQSPGCVFLPVLKGDHALRQWTGAIPLSLLSERQLEQGTETGQWGDAAVLQFEKAFLSCAPPAPLVLSFCVLFCPFSPLPLVFFPLCYFLWVFPFCSFVCTSLGKRGGWGWLIAGAKRSSIALRTTVWETGLSS